MQPSFRKMACGMYNVGVVLNCRMCNRFLATTYTVVPILVSTEVARKIHPSPSPKE